jgi:hypothetical protein
MTFMTSLNSGARRDAYFAFAHLALAAAAILARALALIFRFPLLAGFPAFPFTLAHLAF